MCLLHLLYPGRENVPLVQGEGYDKNMYEGFKAFLVFSGRDVLGPFTPTQAAPSSCNVPSCHAEIEAIKQGMSRRKKLSKATLVVTRWHYCSEEDNWSLTDGIPCSSCVKFCCPRVARIIVSTSDGNLVRMHADELISRTKPSTGMLYGQ